MGPAAEQLPHAAEPPRAPDADLADVRGGHQDKVQPRAPADGASTGNATSDVPAAAPASASHPSIEQTGTLDMSSVPDMPAEPADDSAEVLLPPDTPPTDNAPESGRPAGNAPVPAQGDQPGEPAAIGAAGTKKVDASDPAAAAAEAELQSDAASHAPAAAAADAPLSAASADASGGGTLDVPPQSQEPDGQQDEEGPHGTPAGREAVDEPADAMPAAAPKTEPVTEPPAAGGVEAGSTVGPLEVEQADFPVPASARGTDSSPSTSDAAALPPDTDASSETHGAAPEQLAAPPADIPADTQVLSWICMCSGLLSATRTTSQLCTDTDAAVLAHTEDGTAAAAQPSPAGSSVPSSNMQATRLLAIQETYWWQRMTLRW